MKNMHKSFISFLLTLMLVIGTVPFCAVTAYAATSAANEAALIKAVTKGGDIKLTQNIDLTDCLTISEGQTITLDLNGKTLNRGMSEYQESGSVIRVEPGATLTVLDGSFTNVGTITGGFAFNGGGICNYGTLTLKGGVIKDNYAQNGGGVYNGEGATLIIEENVIQKKVGTQVTSSATNVVISGNEAESQGGGIYNAETMNISGAPTISENANNDDLFLADGKVITVTGELNCKGRIGVWANGTNPVITSGYSAHNTANPAAFFFSANSAAVLQPSDHKNVEIMLKTDNQTTLEFYENGKLVKKESHNSPQVAWNRGKVYAEQDEYDSSSRINAFESLSDYIVQRLGLTPADFSGAQDQKNTGHLKNNRFVVITLGSDWNIDTMQTIDTKQNIVLDLNGHCVNRGRNFKVTKYGCVFGVGNNARFTILDSNPNAKGYDGLKGGVITGGAGDDGGGGIVIYQSGELDMFGGTIYKCTTDYHGGAILTNKEYAKIVMRNCTIDSCKTENSGDECNGGGICIRDAAYVVMNNVTIRNCYSEDNGGGMYLGNKPRFVFMKNCLFSDNSAHDGGGGLHFGSLNNDTAFKFTADNCNFSGNKCTDGDGGGVHIYDNDDEDRNPIIFRNCIFMYNESKRDGAALEIDDDLVVLQGGTITNNKAGRWGAIYVEDKYDISVGGKLIIKDNKASNQVNKDLVLEKADKKAYIYCAGLDEGSYISVSNSKSAKGIASVVFISKYQVKYFHPESGTLTFAKKGTKESTLVTASLFGEGSVKMIIIMSAIVILGFAAMLLYKKKKGGIADDQE